MSDSRFFVADLIVSKIVNDFNSVQDPFKDLNIRRSRDKILGFGSRIY